MNYKKQPISLFYLLVKGVFIGLSSVIPGVSAGTAALMMNLYIPLIDLVNKVRFFLFRKIGLESLFQSIKSLAPALLGIVIGFFLTVWWMSYVITTYPIQTFSFFSGAVLSSLPLLLGQVMKGLDKNIKKRCIYISVFLISTCLSFIFLFISLPHFNSSFLWFLLSIYLGVGAMLLPGLSGSYILILMGTYSEFLQLFKSISILKWLASAVVILLSLFTVSMWIQYLLRHYKHLMMSFLIGITLGGAVGVFPFQLIQVASSDIIIQSAICFIIGLSVCILSSKEVSLD